MKLKAIGLKFTLGVVLLSLFAYILLTLSSVFSSRKYDLLSFQNSEFVSEQSSLVIFVEEATFIRDEEIFSGQVSLVDGVIYLAADESFSFVVISNDSLFYSPKLQHFDRMGG